MPAPRCSKWPKWWSRVICSPYPGPDRGPPTNAGCAMLRLEAEAVTGEPNGRGAPAPQLVSGGRRYRARTTGDRGRFRHETGLLMLVGDGPKGYSSLGGAPAGLRTGKFRIYGSAAPGWSLSPHSGLPRPRSPQFETAHFTGQALDQVRPTGRSACLCPSG
jgi:hypothetical protein